MDAPGNDGNASMPEQVKRPNPWRKKKKIMMMMMMILPVPVAARSKAWVYGRLLAGIVSSNPTGDMDVCML